MNGGYPDEDDIKYLQERLMIGDFFEGALVLKEFIDATHYGRATITKDPPRFEVATGGWSGCEEILGEIHFTLWWVKFWQEMHKGGLWVFYPWEG